MKHNSKSGIIGHRLPHIDTCTVVSRDAKTKFTAGGAAEVGPAKGAAEVGPDSG